MGSHVRPQESQPQRPADLLDPLQRLRVGEGLRALALDADQHHLRLQIRAVLRNQSHAVRVCALIGRAGEQARWGTLASPSSTLATVSGITPCAQRRRLRRALDPAQAAGDKPTCGKTKPR